MAVVPGSLECALYEGHEVKPRGKGLLTVHMADRAPEGLLRALEALFSMGKRVAPDPRSGHHQTTATRRTQLQPPAGHSRP